MPDIMGSISVDRNPNMYDPIFLLAPARSHSSVVVTMIGSHPQLYGFPELVLFDKETIGERLATPPPVTGNSLYNWNSVVGLERAIAELEYGSQDDHSIKLARRWLEDRRDWSGVQVMDHLLGLIFPRRGVEKSPETVQSMDNMMRMANAYPRARFIHLVRHPVTAQRSVQRYYFLRVHPANCAKGWISQHKRILEFRNAIGRDRSIMVSSEDILNQPDVYLRDIADWLGIESDDESINAMFNTSKSPYVHIDHSERYVYTWNDPTFLMSPTPHSVELPSSLEQPVGWNIGLPP